MSQKKIPSDCHPGALPDKFESCEPTELVRSAYRSLCEEFLTHKEEGKKKKKKPPARKKKSEAEGTKPITEFFTQRKSHLPLKGMAQPEVVEPEHIYISRLSRDDAVHVNADEEVLLGDELHPGKDDTARDSVAVGASVLGRLSEPGVNESGRLPTGLL